MKKFIVRDISWLSFNGRVLQEAADKANPLKERIRFLGIFSNNLDEFFRVRVATISRMIEFGRKADLKMHVEKNPRRIMHEIRQVVLLQQNEFNRIWNEIVGELKKNQVFIKTENQLTVTQQRFVRSYFDSEVRGNIIPLMVESIPVFPNLRDKSIYLAVLMSASGNAYQHKFAVIEIPTRVMNRFVLLPSSSNQTNIILLEDVVRYNLKYIFAHTDFDMFESWIFKMTRDAEIDMDNDLNTDLIQKIEAGLKKRKKGKTVRLVYDSEMDARLLSYLTKRLNLQSKDNFIPGKRIHNFRDFMDFPDVLSSNKTERRSIVHPELRNTHRVTDVVLKKDVMLCVPYHSFDAIIDMLREAAMDDTVLSIQITAYRVASNSKVMNALINAARNGKQVTVMLELRARFDEEANLVWKKILEEEGIKVLLGIPEKKVHAKLCVIKKKIGNRSKKYGFISTGNLNEKTARVYSDFCLLTSNTSLMADAENIFKYLEKPTDNYTLINKCKQLVTCPNNLRDKMKEMIDYEIKQAKKKKTAMMILKMNSLSDEELIEKLYDAAKHGVKIRLIVRGIFCLVTELHKIHHHIQAISIVDEYLEHGRIFYFHHGGNEQMFISSADWMVRNLNHRIEASCPIHNKEILHQLKEILTIQLHDNVKARVLDNHLQNNYRSEHSKKKIRSQIEVMKYLAQ